MVHAEAEREGSAADLLQYVASQHGHLIPLSWSAVRLTAVASSIAPGRWD